MSGIPVVLSNNPNGAFVGDSPPACGCGPSACYGPRPIFGASGIIGYPNVTAYVGQLPTSLDGQPTSYLYPGLRVETNINGYAQSWVVKNLGTGQPTVVDGNGNYTIIRAIDTAVTGLCFVFLN